MRRSRRLQTGRHVVRTSSSVQSASLCIKTERRSVDIFHFAGRESDKVGADEVEHAGIGGGRGSVLCGSLVEAEGIVGLCCFSDWVEAFWGRSHGVNTVVPIIDSDLGGRDVCFGDSRRAGNGEEQGD